MDTDDSKKTSSVNRDVENPGKVFDTSGIESALAHNNTTVSQASNKPQTNDQSSNENDATGDVASLNGVFVSSSLGTARTALIKPGGRKR
ncbi:MAG: hypothetical protein K0R55_4305 [Sporomusa sp.]|jgi:hypothetical protein|nr:hypothetical protein [Sporomusa sp.]